MKKITVSTQILSGNLGDGWNDQNEAAAALAEYTEATWTDDLSEFAAQGYELEFDIDVERNTSGCGRGMNVSVDSDDELDHDDIYNLEQKIENTLTDEGRIWEKFCNEDLPEGLTNEH
jgi:hypothetical protein